MEIILTIENESDLSRAAEFLPELMYPYYIPEGYTLKMLEVVKRSNASYDIYYHYTGLDETYFAVTMGYVKDVNDTATISIDNVEEQLDLPDRTIYIWKNPALSCDGVTFVYDGRIVQITGDIDSKEKINIAQEIRYYN